MIERDIAITKYIFERAENVTTPVPRSHLVRDYCEKTGSVINERIYERGFERVIQRIMESSHPPSLIARACFLLGIPITDDERLLKKLEKIATITLDDDGRICKYTSKCGPVINLVGVHRKIMKAVRTRREKLNHAGQGEEEEEDIIEEEPNPAPEDAEIAYDDYPYEQKPDIHRTIYYDSMGNVQNEIEEPEAKIARLLGMVSNGNMAPETSSGRLSNAPSIASIQNNLPIENHYANFLKGTHFFLQDYAKNPLELKKMAREAKEKNEGMNLTPQTLMSYLEVCLGDVICLAPVQRASESTVNLKEFLEELRRSAEDFGDEFEGRIASVVDRAAMDIGDNDKVSLKLLIDAFGNMVNKLKARVDRHRTGI